MLKLYKKQESLSLPMQVQVNLSILLRNCKGQTRSTKSNVKALQANNQTTRTAKQTICKMEWGSLPSKSLMSPAWIWSLRKCTSRLRSNILIMLFRTLMNLCSSWVIIYCSRINRLMSSKPMITMLKLANTSLRLTVVILKCVSSTITRTMEATQIKY